MTQFKSIIKMVLFSFSCLSVGIEGVGQTKDFQLKIENYRGAIQWEQSFDHLNWTVMSGATSGTHTTKPKKTTYYRAKITEAGCVPVYSDVKAAYIDSNKTVPAKLVKGIIALPTGSSIQFSEISVLSLIDSVSIKQDGSFEILVADSTKEDLLLATNKSGDVFMMAYYFATEKNYTINTTSTSLALLICFPLLKPVELNRKLSLIDFYKKEIEFNQLVSEVERISKTGTSLFSVSNTELIRLIALFVNKPVNSDRFRMQQNQRTKADQPITITSFGTSVKIENTADHTYAAEIYKKDGQVMIERFTLSGTTLEGSIPLQEIANILQGTTDIKTTRTFDLKAKNYPAGEYEIRLWSGLLDENNQPNNLAARENILSLYCMIIGSLVPSPTDWLKDECIKNIFNAGLNSVNPLNMAQAAKNNSILDEYVYPVFKDYAKFLTGNCLEFKSSKYLKKLFVYLAFAEEVVTDLKFVYSWTTSPLVMEACEYVNDYGQTSTCFVIEPTKNIGTEDYTGDDADLTIKTIANKNYYPKEDGPVPNISFQWTSWKGGGTFSNNKGTDKIVLVDQTDQSGFASAKWKYSCDTGIHVTRARVNGIPNDREKDLYTIRIFNPEPKAFAAGDGQTGLPLKMLEKKLDISVRNMIGNSAMFINRFSITWENVKGSGTIEPYTTVNSDIINSQFSWTLGPEDGEQIVKATIKAKNCEWPIYDNTITFKATTLDTLALLRSKVWTLNNAASVASRKTSSTVCNGLRIDVYEYTLLEGTLTFSLYQGQTSYSEWKRANRKKTVFNNATECKIITTDEILTESASGILRYYPSSKRLEYHVFPGSTPAPGGVIGWMGYDATIISINESELVLSSLDWGTLIFK